MNKLIAGAIMTVAFSAVSATCLSQERFDVAYQRIMTKEESKMLDLLVVNSVENNEKLIFYDYATGKSEDVSEYNFTNSKDEDLAPIFSGLNEGNAVFVRSNNKSADSYRKKYSENKAMYKKLLSVPDKIIESRTLRELPTLDDIKRYYLLKDIYGVENNYIEISGNIYSFRVEEGVSLDSAINAYAEVIEIIKDKCCKLHEFPGKCAEPKMDIVSYAVNTFTPVKILDHNAIFPKINVYFDKADSAISKYLEPWLTERAVVYDFNNNTITDISKKSRIDTVQINIQLLDSIMQKSNNIAIGHNHVSKNNPMTYYPSPEDVLQSFYLAIKFSHATISSRIYPNSTEKMAVEYFIPDNFLEFEDVERLKEDLIENMLSLKLNYIRGFNLQQMLFENSRKSAIDYDFQSIPIIVRGEKKN